MDIGVMGHIKMTARKVLRRSRPHGERGKRIVPSIEEELDELETPYERECNDAYDEREEQINGLDRSDDENIG